MSGDTADEAVPVPVGCRRRPVCTNPRLLFAGCLFGVALITGTASVADGLAPRISLSVDAGSVYAGDSVMLEIEAVGLIEPLDIGALSRDADLISETGGTRIGVVGSTVVEIRSRRLELLPHTEGKLVLGPLSGKGIGGPVRSDAVIVSVLPPPDIVWQPGPDDVESRLTVSTRTPVVGERVMAELQLRHRHAIADEAIVLPSFDGFDVLPVFEQRRTVIDDGHGAWRQIAWRWLLFPRGSGVQHIGAVQWKGEMIRSRTQRGRFTENRESVTLDVAPARGTSWWLPASDVTLSENWSHDLTAMKAGDEVLRTITLRAENVLASQLPRVEMLESRAIGSTLIGEHRDQALTSDGALNATAVFEFRLQAQSPVPVFLDTVRVSWWDTTRREARESILPARRINVGLPERADLLAELALDGRGLDRLWLTVASVGGRQRLWWIALILLASAIAWLLLEPILQRQRRGAGSTKGNALPPL